MLEETRRLNTKGAYSMKEGHKFDTKKQKVVKSKAIKKTLEKHDNSTPMSREISEQRKTYRKNLKESHIKHLHGEY